MGEAKRKKKRRAAILAANPICIFCDDRPSTEIDHIPSRQCFDGRQAPEGFEFATCKDCNSATSSFEQVVAMYLKMNLGEEKPGFEQELNKVITGVANNYPNALPNPFLSANEKRKAAKEFIHFTENFHTYAGAPMLSIPEQAWAILEMFNRKLCCALHFKELNVPVSPNSFIASVVSPFGHKQSKIMSDFANQNFGGLQVTKRSNTNLGNQFIYKHASKSKDGIFGFSAQFNKSFILNGFVVPENEPIEPYWIEHKRDIESNWRWKLDETDTE